MISKITFDRMAGDADASTLSLTIGNPVVRVVMHPRYGVFDPSSGSFGGGGSETRREYDARLRRSAHDFGKFMEREMLSKLREMGHLAN
jgi:hypothetical protein